MTKTDPIAAALLAAKPSSNGSNQNKIIRIYGDRPAVLDAIVTAYVENKCTFEQIGRLISGDGVVFSGGTVKGFLTGKGVVR